MENLAWLVEPLQLRFRSCTSASSPGSKGANMPRLRLLLLLVPVTPDPELVLASLDVHLFHYPCKDGSTCIISTHVSTIGERDFARLRLALHPRSS
jgi:hypothetical protein